MSDERLLEQDCPEWCTNHVVLRGDRPGGSGGGDRVTQRAAIFTRYWKTTETLTAGRTSHSSCVAAPT